MYRFSFIVLLFVLCFAGGVAAQEMPIRADLQDGWNVIQPGGDTICSRGTPYQFWAREGASDNLLVEFQGGGWCWDDLTCSTEYALFDDTVSADDSPVYGDGGIHYLSNPENPFADYDMVFIPYCTGDVHMGDNDVTYTDGDGDGNGDFVIHHKGAVNAQAALDWTYANFTEPESLFITGCSAGALGASFHAPNILAHYDGVRGAVLADSGGGYRGAPSSEFEAWGTLGVLPDLPGFADERIHTLSFNTFWIEPAALFTDATFAEYNTAHDSTQVYFAGIREGQSYEEALADNLSDIAASADNFSSYTAGGDLHCIIPRPEFYTYKVGDVLLRDWVADLAAGAPVQTVACADCDVPEMIYP